MQDPIPSTTSPSIASLSGPKRSGFSLEADNGSKKPRGRPRVEPESGSAADRRRTQIRLAQRAYRMRKETTISSFRDENVQLRKALEDMTDAVSGFYGRALASGIQAFNSGLTDDLRSMTQRLNDVARLARHGNNTHYHNNGQDSPDESPPRSSSSSSEEQSQQHLNSIENTGGVVVRSRPSMSSSSSSDTRESDRVPLTSLTSPEETMYRGPKLRLKTQTDVTDISSGLSNTVMPPPPPAFTEADALQVALPTPDASLAVPIMPNMTLPVPSTYSFLETTFSRRLHRACLEQGFHLLTYPEARPDAVMRKFSSVLQHITIPQLRARISGRLLRPESESLNNADPLSHRGSALSNGGDVAQNGPEAAPSGAMQLPAGGSASPEEGWLSMDDVQNYVEAKGLYIGPRSTFAEGEVVSLAPVSENSVPGIGAPFLQSPPQTPASASFEGAMFGHNWPSANSATGMAFPSVTGNAIWPFAGAAQNDDSHHSTWRNAGWMLPQRTIMWKKTKFVLDVARFVSALVEYSVCRGPTPGIHVKDVEQAFHDAAFTVR